MAAEPRNIDVKAAVLVTLLAFLWGGNPIAIKIGLADAPPIRQAWMRFVLGGLTVLVWAWAIRTPLRIHRREVRPLLVLGVIFTVQIALLNLGVKYTSAGHVAILLNAYPIYTVLLAHFFVPGDRLSGGRAVGVLIAYAGVVLLFSPQFDVESAFLLGDLLTSGSAFLLGVRTIYLNRAVQRIDPVKLLLAQVAFSVPCYLLVSLLFEAAHPYRWTWSLGLALGFQGFIVAGFNFILNLQLLKTYKPSGLAAYFLTTPIFGVFLSWVILDEAITLRLLTSAVLVVGGVALASRPSGALSRKPLPKPSAKQA
ncbi:MAG: DMT family transporter [candidate division NC10 bacterium]|nr:DMT family transporter [candidate division NC10 bacterium]